MARIYRVTDKIEYKVGELTFKVSPLTVEDKIALTGFTFEAQKGNLKAMVDLQMYALRCGLKEITGLEDADGNPYQLAFENNKLTEECVQDLMNIEQSAKMIGLICTLMNGIPTVLPEGISLANVPKTKPKVSQK